MYMDPLMRCYREYRSEKESGISKLESISVAKYRYAWLNLIMQIHQYVDQVEWDKKHQHEGSSSSSLPAVPPCCPTTNLPWLMKDPNHSAYLPQLLEIFPDAKLIFTHRSPIEIIPSLAKLMIIFVSMGYKPYSVRSASKDIGYETILRMKHYTKGIVEFTKSQQRQLNSPYRFHMVRPKTRDTRNETTGNNQENDDDDKYGAKRRIDFYFKDVVQDIPNTIQTICKELYPNLPPPSEEAKEAFRKYLYENERHKTGNQPRSLDDFHLTFDDLHSIEEFRIYDEVFISKFIK